MSGGPPSFTVFLASFSPSSAGVVTTSAFYQKSLASPVSSGDHVDMHIAFSVSSLNRDCLYKWLPMPANVVVGIYSILLHSGFTLCQHWKSIVNVLKP